MSTLATTRDERRQLERDNAKLPLVLIKCDDGTWRGRGAPPNLIEVWRSRLFLVQVFAEANDILRASVNRSVIDSITGRWKDGISWEDLQSIKREIGRGHLDAVEIFPADRDVVNVANMRHLWILPEKLPFGWRK